MHLHSVPSLAHAIKQPSTASTPPAVFCKPRLDLHTNQRKYENRHVCWENWKKGGHELNGSTPCCVTQQIPLLIISNTCVTNAKVLSVCVMCLWCPDCGVLYFIPCIYSHARWSYRRRFRSLLLCPLSVECYYFPLFGDPLVKGSFHTKHRLSGTPVLCSCAVKLFFWNLFKYQLISFLFQKVLFTSSPPPKHTHIPPPTSRPRSSPLEFP